jgi:5-methylcytosine-specific restriction enzyme A
LALKPLKRCPVAGCNQLTRQSRCEKHAKERTHYADEHRPNSYQRGYDKRWAAFRQAYLADHPLCRDCDAEGHVTAAAEVHHIKKLRDRPDLQYEEANLLGLCKRHHSARTARGE